MADIWGKVNPHIGGGITAPRKFVNKRFERSITDVIAWSSVESPVERAMECSQLELNEKNLLFKDGNG